MKYQQLVSFAIFETCLNHVSSLFFGSIWMTWSNMYCLCGNAQDESQGFTSILKCWLVIQVFYFQTYNMRLTKPHKKISWLCSSNIAMISTCAHKVHTSNPSNCRIYKSFMFAREDSKISMQSPIDLDSDMAFANFSWVAMWRLKSVTVFNTAHRTWESAFFWVNPKLLKMTSS